MPRSTHSPGGPRHRPDGLININPKFASDPFYRYTMPPFEVRVVSAGTNGVKTLLYNVDKIASSLKRPVDLLLKYLSYDLGAPQAGNDSKEKWINGAWEPEQLQISIDKFVATFAVCARCGDPATHLQVSAKKKHRTVALDCGACGALSKVVLARKIDDKIAKYICNNPPPSRPSKSPSMSAAANTTVVTSHGVRGLDVLDAVPGSSSFNVAESEDWSDTELPSPTPEEVRGRAAALGPALCGLTLHDDQQLPKAERLLKFEEFLRNHIEHGCLPPREAHAESVRLDCGTKAAAVVAKVVLTSQPDGDLASAISVHQKALELFLVGNTVAQAHAIIALSEAVTKNAEQLLPRVLRALVFLHETDLLLDSVIIKWYNNLLPSGLKSRVAPFIEWLQGNIESDSEDSGDEETAGDVVFTADPTQTAIDVAHSSTEDNLEEDLDALIDSI
eukprot:m.468393 g.468393  ORF g.468393 m.468393 type:complete len:447 (+) comp27439_c0_seq1:178-1518(+)